METAKQYECQIYKKIAIESLQNCWKKEVAMPPQKCLLPCASRSLPLLRSQPQPLSNATERWQGRQRATPQSCWRQRWKGTRPSAKGGIPQHCVLSKARGCQLEKAGSMRLAKLRKGGACLYELRRSLHMLGQMAIQWLR